MPAVYRIGCDSCGYTPKASGGVAGYVATEGDRQGGIVLPAAYSAVRLDTNEFVALLHPVEDSMLREQGFTWEQASKEGRLHSVTFKFCRQCGVLHEERQIYSHRDGCIPMLVLGLVTVLLMKFVGHRSWGLAFFTGYLATAAGWMLIGFAGELRWRNQNSISKLRKCSACQSTEFVPLEKSLGNLLPCPHCRSSSMRCTRAGIS